MYNKTIAIVGLGGLGGYVCEYVSRIGFKKIILIDGDKFSESNLNRQLLSNKETIGTYKVDNYATNILKCNDLEAVSKREYICENNLDILDDAEIIIDCLDNIETRLLLEKYCAKTNKTMIHGSIGSDFGTACICLPGSNIISKLYKNKKEEKLITKANSVALIASYQVELLIKFVENNYNDLVNKILYIDLDDLIVKKIEI